MLTLAAKEGQNAVFVGLLHHSNVGEVPLLLGLLLGEDVAFVSVLSPNLSCTGQRKALLCAGVSLDFRH